MHHTLWYFSSLHSLGKVPSVLACRALCTLPVLCCGPHGWVQHASVYPERVQSHRRQGRFPSVKLCCYCMRQQQDDGFSSACFNWTGHQRNLGCYLCNRVCLCWQSGNFIACRGFFFPLCLFRILWISLHLSGRIWTVHSLHRPQSSLVGKKKRWFDWSWLRTGLLHYDVQYASLHKFIPKIFCPVHLWCALKLRFATWAIDTWKYSH